MGPRHWHSVHLVVALLVLLALAAIWSFSGLSQYADPGRLRDAVAPIRTSWVAFPLTIAVFVLAELVLFPVLVLIFACGLAFGPWLGALYAMTGSLASSVIPFLVGKKLGRQRLLRWGGAPARKLVQSLDRRGLVAVFLVHKIPAPFTLVNMACGACGVGLSEYLLGTLLSMAGGIVLITVVGANLFQILADPEPRTLALGLGMGAAAITAVLVLQRVLNRRLESRR